jgi:chemosensory pili system protein ChpA (sensor histidine kinase/response regulator)
LLVRQGERVVALSTHGIEDIHYATEGQVQQLGEEIIFHSGEGMHTLDDMEDLLHSVERRVHPRASAGSILLLVRLEDGAVRAVRVQEILDSRDLVVKKLNRYVPRIQGVVGAAILGDGNVAPVLDLPELLRAPSRAAGEGVGATSFTGTSTGSESRDRLTALVVDDSLSARRATAQFMKDSGFEVRTAIDGMEAAAILDKWTPSIMLVDMEMPRMNGLELTTHVRGKPATAGLPIVMITSRSTEKHRQQAQNAGVDVYLTKPYRDATLLDHLNRLTVGRDG